MVHDEILYKLCIPTISIQLHSSYVTLFTSMFFAIQIILVQG